MYVDFEDRLGAALRGTADAFTPGDPQALVAAGHARGRRLRRRRTAGVAAGVAAVVLVAAGGVAAGTVLAHPGSGPARVVPPAATTRPVVTGEEMSAALSSLLLPGSFINVTGRPPGTGAHPATAQAYAVWQGEARPYEIVLSLGSPDPGRATCPAPAPSVPCKVIPVQDGTLVVTSTSAFTADGSEDAASISVWFRTARYAVAVEERGPTSGTPDDLPVDQAGLERIALAGIWRELAATLPPSIPAPAL